MKHFVSQVRVWEADQDMTTATDKCIALGERLEMYIDGLEIGKLYNLRVLAYSLGGDGKMSSPPIRFSMGKFTNKNRDYFMG